jgi:hypothetical protein
MHVTQTPLEPVTLVILAFLALVVVAAPPCPVVEEVYSLGFFLLAQTFTGMGFLTFPSMRVTLPLNQMLALVAVVCVILKLL